MSYKCQAEAVATKRYNQSRKGRAARKRYNQSRKGRATTRLAQRRYHQSSKGRANQKRHDQSRKGRARHKRYEYSSHGRAMRLVKVARRRALKLGLTVKGWNFEIGVFYARAQELRGDFLYVSVDHIIPLAQGGSHAPWNLQIILHHENCEKGDRPDYEPSVIFW